jgi:cholesterol transport system auxiliary component
MRALAVVALLLAGCVNAPKVPPMEYYVLGDARPATARRVSQAGAVLLVQPSGASAFYDTQRLVYSRASGQRAYYQFAAWTERPGRALATLLSRRLGAPLTTAGVRGDLVLHTHLEELYHDAATHPGSARISVSAQLADSHGRLVAAERFSSAAPAGAPDAAGAVAAANRATEQVLDRIAAWAAGHQAGADPRVEPALERPHLADAAAP